MKRNSVAVCLILAVGLIGCTAFWNKPEEATVQTKSQDNAAIAAQVQAAGQAAASGKMSTDQLQAALKSFADQMAANNGAISNAKLQEAENNAKAWAIGSAIVATVAHNGIPDKGPLLPIVNGILGALAGATAAVKKQDPPVPPPANPNPPTA